MIYFNYSDKWLLKHKWKAYLYVHPNGLSHSKLDNLAHPVAAALIKDKPHAKFKKE